MEGIANAGFYIICKITPIIESPSGDIAITLAFSEKLRSVTFTRLPSDRDCEERRALE